MGAIRKTPQERKKEERKRKFPTLNFCGQELGWISKTRTIAGWILWKKTVVNFVDKNYEIYGLELGEFSGQEQDEFCGKELGWIY